MPKSTSPHRPGPAAEWPHDGRQLGNNPAHQDGAAAETANRLFTPVREQADVLEKAV